MRKNKEQAEMAQVESATVVENNVVEETPQTKPQKRTDEELEALLAECKQNVGKKCQAVPFGTIEWLGGHIHGAFIEKRARKVLYDIRLDNGKSIKKVHDNNLLKISDEMAEVAIKTRAPKGEPKGPWDDEDEINAELEKWASAVGKTYNFEDGTTGRVVGLVVEKRAHVIQLRVKMADEKLRHMTAKDSAPLSPDFDEEGLAMQEAYQARRAKGPRKVMTVAEKIEKLEAEILALQAKIAEKEAKIKELRAEPETVDAVEDVESIEDLA